MRYGRRDGFRDSLVSQVAGRVFLLLEGCLETYLLQSVTRWYSGTPAVLRLDLVVLES
jgi:hypothetical protein